MQRIVLALGLALALSAPVVASPSADVAAVPQRFITAFNAGNFSAAIAGCAPEAAIVDDFPPHAWHGAAACAHWARDYVANAKQNAITAAHVVLATPLHVEIDGDTAYVVFPAVYTYKDHGKPTTLNGVFTVSLRKVAEVWRMTGWAWADH